MKRKIINVFLALVLVLSFSLVTAGPVGAVDPIIDLAVNGESPWTSQAFTFTDVLPGEALASFPVKFKNMGSDAGALTFSISYVESDMAGTPAPNMDADEFASLVYVAAVTHQYFCPAYPEGGGIHNDLPNWLAMDLNADGKVSLYELMSCSPIPWATELDDTLPAGEASEFVITFKLGDSLAGGVAGGAILTGVEDSSSQGDGISVTVSATLVQVGDSLSDTEESSGNVFQAFGVAGPVENVDTGVTYDTIQAAINDALSGQTISVAAGDYDAFDANKAGIKVKTTEGAEITANPITVNNQANAIVVSAHNVTIDGFTIDVDTDIFSTGINIFGATPPHGAVIKNNTIDFTSCDPNNAGSTWPGACIQAQAGTAEETTTTIEDNYVAFDKASFIEGSTYQGYEGIAVWGMHDADYIISDNDVNMSDTTKTKYHNGISVHGTSSSAEGLGSAKIDKNTIYVSQKHADAWKFFGIYILGLVQDEYLNNVTITNNTVTGLGNKGYAVRMSGSETNHIDIMYNDFKDWDIGIATECGYDASCDDVHVNYNNIVGNSIGMWHGIDWGGTVPTLDATLNWWGDISGPEHDVSLENWPEIDMPANPGGTGDKVSDYVNYIPWLTRDFQTVIDDNISYFGFPMVNLNAGWNTFSTPIALDPGCATWGSYKELGDGLALYTGGDPYYLNAYYFDGVEQMFGEVSDGYRLTPCDAIYVQMAEPDIAAILYSPNVSVSSKELYAGWNLVGFARFPDREPCREAWRVLRTVEEVTGDLMGWELVVNPPVNWHKGRWHNYWRASEMSEEECLMFCFQVCGGDPDPECIGECMGFCMDGEGEAPPMCITLGYWVFMQNDGTLAGLSSTPRPLLPPQVE